MGQKAKAPGLRLGINSTWASRWYTKQDYSKFLHDDLKIRQYLEKNMKSAGIARLILERPTKNLLKIIMEVARPALIIGQRGAGIDKLKKTLEKIASVDISISIVEVRKPEMHAKLVADAVSDQLEKRVAFRRAMKKAVGSAMKVVQGIRINISGRLNGAEIARMEWYREGRVPLQTLRADIDYKTSTAFTTYGACGVKVWLYRGDIMEHDPFAQDKRLKETGASR